MKAVKAGRIRKKFGLFHTAAIGWIGIQMQIRTITKYT